MRLRGWIAAGCVLGWSLGCMGLGDDPEVIVPPEAPAEQAPDDGVADGDEPQPEEPAEEDPGEAEEDEEVFEDTGLAEPPPERDRKAKPAPRKGKERGAKGPKTHCLRASGGALQADLRIVLDSGKVTDGTLSYRDKKGKEGRIEALRGNRKSGRITLTGQAKKGPEAVVVLTKQGDQIDLKIDGREVPGVQKVKCGSR